MAGTDEFDDDYVARLLAEDAKKTSQKYTSQGMSAFLPKRRAADAPKPNTRFLSHIVREADNHNAALKRKEEVEAKRRLRELHDSDERPRKRPRADETAGSKRSRLLKDIVGAAHSESASKYQHRKSSRRKDTRQTNDGDDTKDSRRHRRADRDEDRRRSRKIRRNHSPDCDHVERPRTSRTSSGRKMKDTRHKHTDRSDDDDGEVVDKLTSGSFDGASEQQNIDLEEPVRIRGRGAHKRSSGIDDRFEKGYDPSQDITPDSEGNDDANDWDMALEAMRDRAKWKRNQAARMREAGFEEKEITKWEQSAFEQADCEPDHKDVKWSRKGEVREWDAGKVQQ